MNKDVEQIRNVLKLKESSPFTEYGDAYWRFPNGQSYRKKVQLLNWIMETKRGGFTGTFIYKKVRLLNSL